MAHFLENGSIFMHKGDGRLNKICEVNTFTNKILDFSQII